MTEAHTHSAATNLHSPPLGWADALTDLPAVEYRHITHLPDVGCERCLEECYTEDWRLRVRVDEGYVDEPVFGADVLVTAHVAGGLPYQFGACRRHWRHEAAGHVAAGYLVTVHIPTEVQP